MNDNQCFVLIILAVIIAFFVGVVTASDVTVKRMQTEAIEHNAAHYDSVTGEWKWKDEKK